ncbi:ubiquitin-conjugating enzyme family protein (macronuclear) [Tetrahymena thermophila SB210]|uniref:Ubiquitin-conjugating enzyme family protein n=1 Tax=Tetrahymena thermophila (strain SB210) TaxID=312017 RepID=Q23E99_TETTS|nr:ubiquitin-conjugating enzyme family protein [Tetrahymena thermophila SB210]EAR94854.2 ubiquitin-conjugating enzyme family protein [Tetrahymena thermophila SB210]|eukprot:XP_001015099.2 ubiquitin-conjugating enzyme family protein [Tetrahymena thermophila SB210]
MVYKTNPKVLFEQQIVSNPSRQNLNPENFSFVMALLDSSFNPITDPSIFRFVGNFVYKEKTINSDGSEGQPVFKNKVMEIEICNENSFQVQGTQSYFLKLQYKQMYCFKNIEDFYLVGQFEMDEYSVIQINVVVCDDSDPKNSVKCMEQTQKNQILSTAILQLYYINQLVQLSDKEQPFKPVGQTQFWETNIDYLQNINLVYVKTYVEDDDSLFLSNSNIQSQLLFSNDRTMLQTIVNYSLYKVDIFLQKNQEQHYYRSYTKISDAFSQIGGIFNVFFVIGCIIAQPYSQLQLNRKLFNATFDINKSNKENLQEDSKSSDSSNSSGSEGIQFPCNDQINEIQNLQKKPSNSNRKSKQKNKTIQKQLSEQNQFKQKINRKLNEKFSVFQLSGNLQKQQKKQSFKQYVKEQFNKISVKTSEFLYYYLNCFKLFKSDVIEMVNFGTQQILSYTDVCFVVNKLIELEKLKTVILNEQQVKLFDFIPKPKIDIELVKEFKEKTIQNKQQDQSPPLQSKDKNLNNTKEQEFYSSLGKKQFNILTIQNRTVYEKAKQAQQAFNEIYNNQNQQSEIDLKLIQMLDRDLTQLFQTNTFNDDNLSLLKSQFYNQRQIISPCLLTNIEKFSNQSNQQNNQKTKKFTLNIQSPQEMINFSEQRKNILNDSQTSENGLGIQLYHNRPKNLKNFIEEKNMVLFENNNNINNNNDQ